MTDLHRWFAIETTTPCPECGDTDNRMTRDCGDWSCGSCTHQWAEKRLVKVTGNNGNEIVYEATDALRTREDVMQYGHWQAANFEVEGVCEWYRKGPQGGLVPCPVRLSVLYSELPKTGA